MSASAQRYVIDASVAIKWLFNDEEHTEEAVAALLALQAGRITVVAPDHLHHEVASAIRTATRMHRIAAADADATLQDFLQIGIPLATGAGLVVAGLRSAIQYDCAYYDGLYLALAERADCPLLHADRRLRNTLAGRFLRELWIEDFRLEP
ncbi:MAG: hypothetical protein DCC58_01710 [Chloroflexi bacterium]|nr:MAG: hypothetical protein DCC58_01710 [Chloroflexota bacterium]